MAMFMGIIDGSHNHFIHFYHDGMEVYSVFGEPKVSALNAYTKDGSFYIRKDIVDFMNAVSENKKG